MRRDRADRVKLPVGARKDLRAHRGREIRPFVRVVLRRQVVGKHGDVRLHLQQIVRTNAARLELVRRGPPRVREEEGVDAAGETQVERPAGRLDVTLRGQPRGLANQDVPDAFVRPRDLVPQLRQLRGVTDDERDVRGAGPPLPIPRLVEVDLVVQKHLGEEGVQYVALDQRPARAAVGPDHTMEIRSRTVVRPAQVGHVQQLVRLDDHETPAIRREPHGPDIVWQHAVYGH